MISEIQELIKEVSKLPTLGARSARKIVLFLLKNRNKNMTFLIDKLQEAKSTIRSCKICNNLDSGDICSICKDEDRDTNSICVVESVEDLWVIERSQCFKGRYHVLNGLLSAIDDITPSTLRIPSLVERCVEGGTKEVIMALSLNLEARITSCYIADQLAQHGILISSLAAGIPIGGELNYMDDSTISVAFQGRK